MYAYQTAFSQTCRVIASETRLKLLDLILENSGHCVEELAQLAGMSAPNASNQLSLLAGCGLIDSVRKQQKVIYRPAENPNSLLMPLRQCAINGTAHRLIIQHATAFTHERRIQIARCLAGGGKSFDSLLKKTGMTVPAQTRHLKKLLKRNVLAKSNEMYRLNTPPDDLSKALLALAIR